MSIVERKRAGCFGPAAFTPQQAIRAARPPLAITHQPGAMLDADLRNSELVSL